MEHLKREFEKLTIKDMIIYLLVVGTMTAGIVMLFMGMLLPPEGEIHHSVLTAFGLISVFVASLLGFSLHFSNDLTKFKATVEERIAAITPKQQI